MLSVNPYYNRPSRRGVLAHYREVSRAADRPILLYNIPQRTASDMPNDLLAELAQLDHISGVKQANNDNLALVDGLELYAGNDDILGRVLDMGGAGGILVASHIVGPEMRRMVDEPENRAEIEAGLMPLYDGARRSVPRRRRRRPRCACSAATSGSRACRYVDVDETELETLREALTAHGLLETAAERPSDGRKACASSRSAGWGRSART